MRYLIIFSLLIAFSFCDLAKEEPKEEHKGELKNEETKEKEEEKKGHSWSYYGENGRDHWAEEFKACGGKRQSPINVVRRKCVHCEYLDAIFLENVSKKDTSGLMYLYNDGHKIGMHLDENLQYIVQGGGLKGKYAVAGVHFHWGKEDAFGSEHSIDGYFYPLEMHIVTFDVSRFSTIGEALLSSDGVAVLGVMFETAHTHNADIDKLLSLFSEVEFPNSEKKAEISSLALEDLLPKIQSDSYFRYKGSLTTPPCSEAVIWTLFENPVKISEAQMKIFRSFKSGHKINGTEEEEAIVDNYRVVQPLNGRKVCWSILPKEKVKVVEKRIIIHANSGNRREINFPIVLITSICALLLKSIITK